MWARLRWRRPIDDNLSSHDLLVQLFNQDFLLPSLTTSKDGFRQGRFQGFNAFLDGLTMSFPLNFGMSSPAYQSRRQYG